MRLTYDHKGSDAQEAKRITDAGGFVMNNRVNGVLAVTRSLGDSSMKEFVVGSPYTTETTLGDEDEFLIIACDGVCAISHVFLNIFTDHLSLLAAAMGRLRRSASSRPDQRRQRRARGQSCASRSRFDCMFAQQILVRCR